MSRLITWLKQRRREKQKEERRGEIVGQPTCLMMKTSRGGVLETLGKLGFMVSSNPQFHHFPLIICLNNTSIETCGVTVTDQQKSPITKHHQTPNRVDSLNLIMFKWVIIESSQCSIVFYCSLPHRCAWTHNRAFLYTLHFKITCTKHFYLHQVFCDCPIFCICPSLSTLSPRSGPGTGSGLTAITVGNIQWNYFKFYMVTGTF